MKTIHATVTSAVKLSDKQLKKISETIKAKHTGAKLELETVVDPAVIGGIKLTIDAVEFDATVRGKLDCLHDHLLQQF